MVARIGEERCGVFLSVAEVLVLVLLVVVLVLSASGTLAAGDDSSVYHFKVARMAGSSRRRGTVQFELALLPGA